MHIKHLLIGLPLVAAVACSAGTNLAPIQAKAAAAMGTFDAEVAYLTGPSSTLTVDQKTKAAADAKVVDDAFKAFVALPPTGTVSQEISAALSDVPLVVQDVPGISPTTVQAVIFAVGAAQILAPAL
jgi:hypothetical protein